MQSGCHDSSTTNPQRGIQGDGIESFRPNRYDPRCYRIIAVGSPTDTLIQGYWLPTVRALIELNGGNAQRAIEELQVASAYEVAEPPPFQLGTMFPTYVRGQAYLKLGQGQQAQAEFQKIVDHPGVVINFPLGALARLQLARAYALSGDATKARTEYQDFFALWKDADPDIPILRQAKAEYDKVK